VPSLIDSLHPTVRELARFVESEADRIAFQHGKRCRITQALRTKAQQNALYAKGRTAPGSIVTYVRGGYSEHNYGTAWDLGVFTEEFAQYLGGDPLYEIIGEAIRALNITGLIWGGDFPKYFGGTFRDLPHFEYHLPYPPGVRADRLPFATHPYDLKLTQPTLPAPPMEHGFTPSPEQATAFSDMIGIGVYAASTSTDAGTPKTQERYEQAVLLKRLFHAGDDRWVRRDGK
jgi:hypothetical protein